ncbi:MAG: tRNA (adenosine(37)-N6)-threonylcarbamoyltransferase complex dimerization subunit type 1 TsaB [Leptolyngbya sp. SIO1D8]|nr:tRNA (adenosine(37)-N6)-threonylcarbamoyltransferase complex dimerization subunit type 1 TsaB [Leptolyngbya sp. SIO1D8]
MIGLAIHTSSPELGLALTDFDQVKRHQVWPLGRDLTAYLHACLTEFRQPYDWADLAFVAVAKGPGGFTGTRIGVVVARTLAQQLSIPLFGVSSLAAIAQQYQSGSNTEGQPSDIADIAVAMRAQRGEIFGAIFQLQSGKITVALEETVRTQVDWEAHLQSWPVPYHLITAEDGLAKSVTGVLALAQMQWEIGDRPDWQTVLPFYGQHPVHR